MAGFISNNTDDVGDPINEEYFADVDALTTNSDTHVIPSGKTWALRTFKGAAAYSSETKALLVWDFGGVGEEIIYATHGDGDFVGDREFVGDGVKKLAICLVNDSSSDRTLGGQFTAREIDT